MATQFRYPRALASALAANARVTAFIAPAGYGKSTVAREFAARLGEARSIDCARLRDAADLRAACAEAQNVASNVLIIENAEALAGIAGSLEMLAEQLATAGEQQRIILCSRLHIALANRRQSPAELHVIGPTELVLDDRYAAEILADNGATAAEVPRALALAQGWPMVIASFARCARSGRLAAVLEGAANVDAEQLNIYLTEIALGALDLEALRVLQVASFLPHPTTEDLKHALTDEHEIDAVLERLTVTPFVRRTGSNVVVHPLVQAALSGSPSQSTLRCVERAARAYSTTNPLRAAELFVIGQRPEDAAQVLAELGADALRIGSVYNKVLLLIDPSVLVRYPALWMTAQQMRYFTMSIAQHVAECEALVRNIDRCVSKSMRAMALGVATSVFDESMNSTRAEEILRQASALSEGDPNASMIVEFFEALHDAFLDRPRDPDPLSKRIAPLLVIPEMRYSFESMIVAIHGRITSNIDAQRTALERAREAAAVSQMPVLLPLAHWELACFYWRIGDRERFTENVDRCEATLPDAQAAAFRYLIDCARGNAEQSEEGTEYPRSRLRALLMAAANSIDPPRRLRFLERARDIAIGLQQPGRLAFVELALALEAPSPNAHFDSAVCAAREAGAAILADAIERRDFTLPEIAGLVANFQRPERADAAPLVLNILQNNAYARGTNLNLRGRKVELLAMLALAKRPMRGSDLSERVWPDASPDDARNSLRVTVAALRKALGDDSIRFVDGAYTLEIHSNVDCNRIDAVLQRLRTTTNDRLDNILYAAITQSLHDLDALDGGLPEWEWFKPTLARFTAARRDLLIAISNGDIARGRDDLAAMRLRKVITLDPCDEEARLLMVRLFLSHNDRVHALAEYRDYERALFQELQVKPSPEMFKEISKIGY